MNEACCPLVNIMSCPGFCINPANGIARSLQCHGKLTHVPFFAMVDVFADCSLDVAKRWMVLAVFCIAKQGEHSQVKNLNDKGEHRQPAFHINAIEFIKKERDVVSIAVDTFSFDNFHSSENDV